MIFIEPNDVHEQRSSQAKAAPAESRPPKPPVPNEEEAEILHILSRLGGGPVPIMKLVNEVARESGCRSTDERTAVKLTAMQTIGMMIHVGQLLRVQRKHVRLPAP